MAVRLLGCLALGALLGAGALRAQEQGTGAWRLTPLLRIEAGALNPAAPAEPEPACWNTPGDPHGGVTSSTRCGWEEA